MNGLRSLESEAGWSILGSRTAQSLRPLAAGVAFGVSGLLQQASGQEPPVDAKPDQPVASKKEQVEKSKWGEQEREEMREIMNGIGQIGFSEFQEGVQSGPYTIKILEPKSGERYAKLEVNGKLWELRPDSWVAKSATTIHFKDLSWDGEEGRLHIEMEGRKVFPPLSGKEGRVLVRPKKGDMDFQKTIEFLCKLMHGTDEIIFTDEQNEETGVTLVCKGPVQKSAEPTIPMVARP